METPASEHIEVEVAVASPQTQRLVRVRLPAGSTVADALRAADIGVGTAEDVGIFGRRTRRDQVLRSGDRVEVYRALQVDPKQARRRRLRDTD